MKTMGLMRWSRLAGAAALIVGAATQTGCYVDMGYAAAAPPPPMGAPEEAPGMPGAPQGVPGTAQPGAPGAQPGAPGGEIAVSDFYEPLSAYGGWVDMAPYGRVWVPSEEVVGEDFTPYTTGGQWVDTDQGWVFQSQWDNDWGWATFHYGRWLYTDAYAWAWVPDVEWGPAWVDWRYGGAYVGWAPLAPVGVVLVPASYVFVETRYIAEPAAWRYRVPAQHVTVVYGATQPSREFAVRGSVRWSLGPPAAHVAAAGVVVRPVHYNVPARGEVRVRAAAVRARSGGHARPARPVRTRSRRR